MQKAIGDNLLPASWGFEKNLELIHRAGFAGIELWLGARPWFQVETPDAGVIELRRKVENAGLVVSHVSNSLDWNVPMSSPDPKIRQQAMRNLRRQIETATLLNTDAILVVAGIVTETSAYEDVYQRCVDSLKELGDFAARVHVRIGCENCNAEQRFLLSPREFRLFLADVSHPAVGLHFDTGNIHDTGFPEQWIQMLGHQITRVHIKDVLRHRGRCGSETVYTNIFLGNNNWPKIRAAFDEVGYNGWICAEMEGYKFAPDQQLFDTSAAMDRFIAARF
jgi:L-ribulose-5-phosphate 3-epimerase